MVMAYVLIGVVYAIFNGGIRKVDTHGDWFIPLVWMFLWPLGAISLLARGIEYIHEKYFKEL